MSTVERTAATRYAAAVARAIIDGSVPLSRGDKDIRDLEKMGAFEQAASVRTAMATRQMLLRSRGFSTLASRVSP